MKKKNLVCLVALLTTVTLGQSQVSDSLYMKLRSVNVVKPEVNETTQMRLNGEVVTVLIEDGDTIIIADIDNINISSPRRFESREDYNKYMRYRRYAADVYPYAKEAIRIFREAEYVTQNMKKKKRKKYLAKLSKELEEEFENPLKRLSKTQGKILVKMIERELDAPIYDLITMTRGKLKAFYWNQSSKLYGYRLKEKYEIGQNTILDVVLQDFDISYQVAQE
jgi:hypothetical protein